MTQNTAGTGVEQVDPSTLLVDANVRVRTEVDATLVASVRDLGVLVPIVATRTEQGLRVAFGHRRTLAAVAAGCATVPVVVVDTVEGKEGEIARLVGQWAENEHRTGLSEADKVGAVEQLTLLGVSATQIAKRLHVSRHTVKAAKSVAAEPLAKAAVLRYGEFLTLDQGAVVAEFAADAETVTALVAAAQSGRFDHVAQRARDDREQAARDAEVRAQIEATGVRVVQRGEGINLNSLADADGVALDPDAHVTCPGHAVIVATTWGYVDPATGFPPPGVDEDTEPGDPAMDGYAYEDDDTDYEPGDVADDNDTDSGSVPADQDRAEGPRVRLEWGTYLAPQPVCTDPTGNGHRDRWSSRGSENTPKPKISEMEPEQAEAARAARRDVIDSNKAWKSAVKVRRAWLRTLFDRKTPPKGTPVFLAFALAHDGSTVTRGEGHRLTAELLGYENPVYGRTDAIAEAAASATDGRAQVLALALVLSGYEDSLMDNAWRHVNASTSRYLTFLNGIGYALADVERRAAGLPRHDTDTTATTGVDGEPPVDLDAEAA